MQNTTDILEGLHVLLVSEDEQRTLTLGKALRERRANVGDLRSSSRDPIALRGADVLVIDSRSAQNTQARVNEMRADVRARWASVINLDFASVAPEAGALQFALLENAVAPVTAADRALTERARKENSFTTELLPLGPTRILRALGMAGTTLQVEFASGSESKASLTLSNELLVSCFMERGGTRWEAWKALARVLGLSDASVTVSRLQHPSAMNIMEPLDQALQTAAQERHASAAEIAREEPAIKKFEPAKPPPRPADPLKAPGLTPGAVPALASSAKDLRVQPGRTIMGIAPVIPRPAAPAAVPTPSAQVIPPLPGVRAEPLAPAPAAASAAKPQGGPAASPPLPIGGPELGKPGRTIMGIAPGALPALGAFGVRTATKPEAPPIPTSAGSEATGIPSHISAPTSLLEGFELPTPDNSQDRELLPTVRAPAPSEAELHFNEQGVSRVERLERVSMGDTPTDPAPARVSTPGDPVELEGDGDLEGHGDEAEESTTVTAGAKMERLMEEAARLSKGGNLSKSGSTLGDDFGGFAGEARNRAPTKPFDASVIARALEPEEGGASRSPASPISSLDAAPAVFPRDESQEETMTMERPKAARSKGRVVALSLLAALAAGEVGYVLWTRAKVSTVEASSEKQTTAPAATPAAPTPAPAAPAAAAPVTPAPTAPPVVAERKPAAAAPVPSVPSAPAAPAEAAPISARAPEGVPPPAPAPASPDEPAASPGAGDAEALDALIKDGTRLLAEKNPGMAKPLFEAALAHDSKNPHAQAGLGQALLETGHAAQAQAAFETAIKLRPKRARYRVQLGDALKAQGKLDEARAAWEKALEIDPADRDAPRRLGK